MIRGIVIECESVPECSEWSGLASLFQFIDKMHLKLASGHSSCFQGRLKRFIFLVIFGELVPLEFFSLEVADLSLQVIDIGGPFAGGGGGHASSTDDINAAVLSLCLFQFYRQ